MQSKKIFADVIIEEITDGENFFSGTKLVKLNLDPKKIIDFEVAVFNKDYKLTPLEVLISKNLIIKYKTQSVIYKKDYAQHKQSYLVDITGENPCLILYCKIPLVYKGMIYDTGDRIDTFGTNIVPTQPQTFLVLSESNKINIGIFPKEILEYTYDKNSCLHQLSSDYKLDREWHSFVYTKNPIVQEKLCIKNKKQNKEVIICPYKSELPIINDPVDSEVLIFKKGSRGVIIRSLGNFSIRTNIGFIAYTRKSNGFTDVKLITTKTNLIIKKDKSRLIVE